MAEFVLKDLVGKKNMKDLFIIESAATSSEEVGNEMHIGTKRKLIEEKIPYERRVARKIELDDYKKYDYIIGMDESNIVNMKRIFKQDNENKIYKLLDFSEYSRDIADPWYTGNFDQTYDDVVEGCNGFLKFVMGN